MPATGSASLLAVAARDAFASTFLVTSTNSSGPGSLAQAITDANADRAQDTITFNIPGDGVHVIDAGAVALPKVTSPVIIDGYSQPEAHRNTLGVGDDALILIQLGGLSYDLSISHTGNYGDGITLTAPNRTVQRRPNRQRTAGAVSEICCDRAVLLLYIAAHVAAWCRVSLPPALLALSFSALLRSAAHSWS